MKKKYYRLVTKYRYLLEDFKKQRNIESVKITADIKEAYGVPGVMLDSEGISGLVLEKGKEYSKDIQDKFEIQDSTDELEFAYPIDNKYLHKYELTYDKLVEQLGVNPKDFMYNIYVKDNKLAIAVKSPNNIKVQSPYLMQISQRNWKQLGKTFG